MEIPVPALFMAHLFVFGCTSALFVAAVFIWSDDEPRRSVLWSLAACWLSVSAIATAAAAAGFGALAWLLWLATLIGGVTVLTRATLVRRRIRAARKAVGLPPKAADWPVLW